MQNFWDISNGAKILLLAASIIVLVEGFYLNRIAGGSLATSGNVCTQVVAKWQNAHQDVVNDAKQKYSGAIAAVNYTDGRMPQAKNFKTAIDAAVAKGPNFAGHYAIAEWGCGPECQEHAVVDVSTGQIIATGIPSEAGLQYSINSPTIIVNPPQNLPKPKDLESKSIDDLINWTRLSRDYLTLQKDPIVSLNFLCTENPFDGVKI